MHIFTHGRLLQSMCCKTMAHFQHIVCTFVLHDAKVQGGELESTRCVWHVEVAQPAIDIQPSCYTEKVMQEGIVCLFIYVPGCIALCSGTDNAGMSVQPVLRDTERRRPQGSLVVARSGTKSGKPMQTTGCALRCLS